MDSLTKMFDAISQITTKDLILIGIGSGVTMILFLIRLLKDFFKEYKSVTPLLGTWHTYHFSRVNYRPVSRYEIWNVKRGLFGLKIEAKDEERPNLNYKGRVLFDAAHTVFEFRGLGHKEIKQYRLTQPIPNEDTLMLGFHLSKDFDQEMFVSCKLVSRKKRSKEDAADIMKHSFSWLESECSMRLARHPIVANAEPTHD